MPKRYNEYESWNVVDAKKRTTKEKLLDESNPFRNDPPMAPDPKGPGGPRKKYKDGGDVKEGGDVDWSIGSQSELPTISITKGDKVITYIKQPWSNRIYKVESVGDSEAMNTVFSEENALKRMFRTPADSVVTGGPEGLKEILKADRENKKEKKLKKKSKKK